jgi:O-acetylserine/cysteine efflux transporter
MVAAAILWGSAPVVTKVALESLTPFVLSSVRWTLSLALLGLVLRRSGARPVLDRRIAATALFGMVAFTVLFSYGVQRTSAANTTLIHAATPMLIALLAAPSSGRPSRGPVGSGSRYRSPVWG